MANEQLTARRVAPELPQWCLELGPHAVVIGMAQVVVTVAVGKDDNTKSRTFVYQLDGQAVAYRKMGRVLDL